ncbi:neural cell adhesion molecule L1.1-like isoform X2 [Aquarana catesbeiana]
MGQESPRRSVLLPLRGKFEMPLSDVEWKKEGQLLARINRGRCDYGCGNTSQLFSNGSLWLSHGGKEKEGRYSVTVYNATGIVIHKVDITLWIIEIPAEQVLGPGNTSVLLPLDLESQLIQVNWRKDEQPLGEIFRGICITGCNETYSILLNGSFLLRRVQREDEGRYSAEVYDEHNILIHQTEILLYIYAYQTNVSYGGAAIGQETPRRSVLLPLRSKFEMPLSDVEWKREEQLLARINRGRCDCGCGNTSQLFSNGSLWLSHGGKEVEGRYSVTVYNATGIVIHKVDITLWIIEIPAEQVLGPGNTSVLLPLDLESQLIQVNWRKDEQPLGEIFRGICITGCNETYSILLNGSFLLRCVQREDEGRYSAEVYDEHNILIHQTEILLYFYDNQTEKSPDPDPGPGIIFMIRGAIFVLVLVVSMVYLGKCLCKRRKQKLESLDSTQRLSTYQNLEELTTFIAVGKADAKA